MHVGGRGPYCDAHGPNVQVPDELISRDRILARATDVAQVPLLERARDVTGASAGGAAGLVADGAGHPHLVHRPVEDDDRVWDVAVLGEPLVAVEGRGDAAAHRVVHIAGAAGAEEGEQGDDGQGTAGAVHGWTPGSQGKLKSASFRTVFSLRKADAETHVLTTIFHF